jgi:NAD+ synthase (glutamine-hydrolysing)
MVMPAVRVAMAQINPTVGHLSGNSAKILEIAKRAQQAGAQIVLFPELALTGYPIEDLALSRDFLNASEQTLKDLAKLGNRGQQSCAYFWWKDFWPLRKAPLAKLFSVR